MPVFSKHAFLTHDWGTFNSLGKDRMGGVLVKNHDRVTRIFRGLSGRGLRCWFDEMEMKNLIVDQMCEGIDESAVVVVFLTDRYVEKVRSKDEKDNCKKEFNYAETRKGVLVTESVLSDQKLKNRKPENPGKGKSKDYYRLYSFLKGFWVSNRGRIQIARQSLCITWMLPEFGFARNAL